MLLGVEEGDGVKDLVERDRAEVLSPSRKEWNDVCGSGPSGKAADKGNQLRNSSVFLPLASPLLTNLSLRIVIQIIK